MLDRLIHVLTILAVVAIVALGGSLFTSFGFATDSVTEISWYDRLILPSYAPDGAIIGIAWTLIYIFTALSAFIFYGKGVIGKRAYAVTLLFFANAVLNVYWSYFFFVSNNILYAVLDMILLLATIVLLIKLIRRISISSAVLLYPYALWVLFATVLTVHILILNPTS